ncbi:hypothetical protein PITCH_A920026 [uncultured Desulfobacterium sp.]|uniref:Uncharacterized protein n=1 Tax=uncultured Desulfobacterium sp. TaxID=201089 RepID=A0A445N3X4_9BACT|nr:hypothetical protein PITCH_A920026 [uncultured Desulfobacterium sp.]
MCVKVSHLEDRDTVDIIRYGYAWATPPW